MQWALFFVHNLNVSNFFINLNILEWNIFILDTPVLFTYWALFDICRQVTFHFYLTILKVVEKAFIFYLCLTLMHCNENPIYVFPEKELRGLSPNFHIHVAWAIYIFPGSVHIFSCTRIGWPIVGIYKLLSDRRMWELGLRPHKKKFLFWEYLFRIFGILSLQCGSLTFSLWALCFWNSSSCEYYKLYADSSMSTWRRNLWQLH